MRSVILTLSAIALMGAPQRAGRPPGDVDDGRARAEHLVIESMSQHHMHHTAHLRITARRPEQPGDRQRAAAIVEALRPAVAKYRDYHVALQHGYEIFLPDVQQPVYHFNNFMQAYAETFRFKPDQATSLLYRKTAGGYELVGAMYTAPPEVPEAELDFRVPLSIAQWHAHVNICLPPRGFAAAADWTKFGPEGSLTAEDACAAAGGRFFPQLFGWMVHVYPFEKTLEKIWAME